MVEECYDRVRASRKFGLGKMTGKARLEGVRVRWMEVLSRILKLHTLAEHGLVGI
jgi:hypothetical protein